MSKHLGYLWRRELWTREVQCNAVWRTMYPYYFAWAHSLAPLELRTLSTPWNRRKVYVRKACSSSVPFFTPSCGIDGRSDPPHTHVCFVKGKRLRKCAFYTVAQYRISQDTLAVIEPAKGREEGKTCLRDPSEKYSDDRHGEGFQPRSIHDKVHETRATTLIKQKDQRKGGRTD